LFDRRRGISTRKPPKPRTPRPDASRTERSAPVTARLPTGTDGGVVVGVVVGVGVGVGVEDAAPVTTTVTMKHSFAWTGPLTLSLELV
jgi:hypothetical protein